MEKKKAILIIAIILVLILGGFAFTYWYLNQQSGPEQTNPDNPNTVHVFRPGTNTTPTATTTPTTPVTVRPVTPGLPPIFRKISNAPIAGFVIFSNKDKSIGIRYIDSATGHIFETSATSTSVNQISDTRISQVQESQWGPAGDSVYARYLTGETIQTSFGKLVPTKTTAGTSSPSIITSNIVYAPQTLQQKQLAANIEQFAVAPNGSSIFYTSINQDGITQGILAKPDDTARKLVFSSPISEWLISWFNPTTLVFNSKPSVNVPGFVYFFNPTTGVLSKIFGDVKGLTALPNPAGTLLVYEGNISNTPTFAYFDIKKGISNTLPVTTFPEKCAWSNKNTSVVYCGVPHSIPDGQYPDDWYQGLASFSDELWKIDLANNRNTFIASPFFEVSADMDMTSLKLTPDEKFLLFVNKKDGILWSVDLSRF